MFSSREAPKPSTSIIHTSSKPLTVFACFTAITVACMTLIGWAVNSSFLKSIVPGLTAMNPLTAVCFIMASFSLYFLRLEKSEKSYTTIAKVLAAVVAIIGFIRITAYFLGRECYIDKLLFASKINAENIPNRMAPNTAVAFIFLGLTLLFINYETRKGRRPSQYMASFVALIAMLALIGYFYAVESLQRTVYIPIALHTAFLFCILSLGALIARPESGVIAVITNNRVSGSMARKMLFVAIVFPLVLGFIRIYGQRAGFYNSEFGTAIMVAATIAALTIAILENSKSLEKAETERFHSDKFLRNIIDTDPNFIFIKDSDGRFVLANKSCANVFGLTVEQLIGKKDSDVNPNLQEINNFSKDDYEVLNSNLEIIIPEEIITDSDGQTRYLQTVKKPILSWDGEENQLIGFSADITDRKQAEAELRESEERFRQIAENIEVVFWMTSVNGDKVTYISPAYKTVWGKDPESLYMNAWEWAESIHPDDRDRVVKAFSEQAAFGDFYDEYRIIRADGEVRWIANRAFPVSNSSGEVYRLAGIAEDITDQKAVTRELNYAKEEAEKLNQAKNEYLSRMSHELRTPMNSILGFGQMLEMSELPPKQQMRVQQILKAGKHLLNLIDEVLNIARIESGNFEISSEPVSVEMVIQEAVSLIQPMADDHNITISLDESDDVHTFVKADRQRLSQVLLNLLSNSIKYNHEGGKVNIDCKQTAAGWLQIAVSDTGIGISADMAERLFIPFDRLGAEQSEVEGTGLGLALSKRLMEAMGGMLGLDTYRTQGSSFHLELPLTESPLNVLDSTSSASMQSNLVTQDHWTVLYVENNHLNVRLMEDILENRTDIKLLIAMQGRLGFDLAKEHVPDLILLDLDLPDISGQEVLKLVREQAEISHIPVIVISADATKSRIEKLMNAGVQAYLTKPLQIDKLRQLFDQYLVTRRQESA